MAQRKYASWSTVVSIIDNIKSKYSTLGHKHTSSDITDLKIPTKVSELTNDAGYVPSTRTVNGKALSSNITLAKADVGLGNVDNTADSAKSVKHATTADSATNATSATKATQDASGNTITSTYETKTDASAKLAEAKGYTDTKTSGLASTSSVSSSISTHNTSSTAHNDIRTSISNLTTTVNGKADSVHEHDIDDVDGLSAELAAKVPTSRTINNKALTGNISLTATDVGAATIANVNTAVSNHNTSTSAHSDIRGLISDLSTKLNNFLDIDDATTDQLSEVIELINNNKGTLESLTTSKVNVSDIVDNLTTSSASKVLSAKQGVAIKALIDALDSELDTKAAASVLTSHTSNTSNPHGVTKSQVGLGNVPNVATNDQAPTYTQASTLATLVSGEKLSVSMGKIMKAITDLISHIGNKSNPHGVTAAQVNAYTKSEVDTKLETKANASALATAQSKLDTIESNAQVNVNPDWNENDATKDSYIQNRPFYTGDPILTTVVNNVTFTTTNYNGLGMAQNPFALTLEENKDYVVTWNGTDYRTTCIIMDGLLAIGNGSIFGMGEDTGAPFLIGVSGSNIMLYATSYGNVTITIKRDDAEVYKINPKYIDIPEGAYVGEARQNGAEVFNDYENNIATGSYSHAEGAYTEASGHWSHSEGYHAKAYGRFSHAEGWATKARGEAQHVQGKYNIEDTAGTYAHIVGNGVSSAPSNAHTLDWNGNAWYKGTIKVGGTSYADASEVALVSTTSLSISTSGWSSDSASGFYRLAITNSSVTANSVVNVNLDIASLSKAEDCGLKGVTESYDGGFYVYAESAPTSALTGTLVIQN